MKHDELLARISIDPKVCFGKPCIRGHRIWVSFILDLLAGGWSIQDVLTEYPQLTDADVCACIAYGAEMSRERLLRGAAEDRRVKLKLDENLGTLCEQLLRSLGHDVSTVPAQGLQGADDREVIGKCRGEKRCLVTLDMDFANPFMFKPSEYSGIAVLRLPPRPDHADVLRAIETLGRALLTSDVQGNLWIVQEHRIRVYQPDQ